MKFCAQSVDDCPSEYVEACSDLRSLKTEKLRSIASHSNLWLGSKTSFDAAQADYRDDLYSGRMTKKKIAYFYDAEVGNFYYGQVRGTTKSISESHASLKFSNDHYSPPIQSTLRFIFRDTRWNHIAWGWLTTYFCTTDFIRSWR